jgi:hypothetical protein
MLPPRLLSQSCINAAWLNYLASFFYPFATIRFLTRQSGVGGPGFSGGRQVIATHLTPLVVRDLMQKLDFYINPFATARHSFDLQLWVLTIPAFALCESYLC